MSLKEFVDQGGVIILREPKDLQNVVLGAKKSVTQLRNSIRVTVNTRFLLGEGCQGSHHGRCERQTSKHECERFLIHDRCDNEHRESG